MLTKPPIPSSSSRFQPGEGPSRGLLRDYEPSDNGAGRHGGQQCHYAPHPSLRWTRGPGTRDTCAGAAVSGLTDRASSSSHGGTF